MTKIDLLDMPLNEVNFVVFDLETTGLHPENGDQIIEIGAFRIHGNFKFDKKDQFHSLVSIDREISEYSHSIHGISNEQLKNAPDICTAMYQFLEFGRDAIPVAHKASKDVAFMRAAMSEYSITNPFPFFIDTLKMAKIIYPDYKSHSLDSLIEKLNIRVDSRFKRHRALYDAEATAKIFVKMCRKIFSDYCYHLSELKELISK
ncbi:MAG: 3'-5' exoribonuclease [Calditerrivibrio sp.]|nr:3'-5' exoribonuclease [Calditerrivibrio sp.]MCA1981220.1 3'-5' exoribonuclease [Calditerrivibrio sp.]